MKRDILHFALGVSLLILLSSWGNTGHSIVSYRLAEALGDKIVGFDKWIPYITEHSSDPDFRKSWDNSAEPNHYIDIDNFPDFKTAGKINTNYDSLIARYGQAFVLDQGTLPWATQTAFDSLRFFFENRDWDNAKRMVSNLCHYVGDGHMPLHVTRNYNGQETNNKGIHSRYESKMILQYAGSITGEIKPAEYIQNVDSFVFGYLYQSNRLYDSILKADHIAKQVAGSNESDAYLASLWGNTGQFTQSLLAESTHALGSLIYTAWVRAGSPVIDTTETSEQGVEIVEISPNPVDSLLTINFQIHKACAYKIEIRSLDGGMVRKVENDTKEPGRYSCTVDVSDLNPESYMVLLHSARYTSKTKVVII